MNANQRHFQEIEQIKEAVSQGLTVYGLQDKNGKFFHHVYSEFAAKEAVKKGLAAGYQNGEFIVEYKGNCPDVVRTKDGQYKFSIGAEKIFIPVTNNQPQKSIVKFMEELTGKKIGAKWLRNRSEFSLWYV